MKHKQEKLGELALIGEILTHAFFPIMANVGAKQLPQIQFLAYITLISLPLFLATQILRKKTHELHIKKYWPQLIAYTFLIAVIPYGIIVYATRFTSSINTVLFSQSEILFAALFSAIFWGESIKGKRLIGILLVLAANVLILYNGKLSINPADLAIFLAPAMFVVGNRIAKKLSDHIDWSTILVFRGILGSTVLLLVAQAVEGLTMPDKSLWLFLVFMGIIAFGIPKIFWQIALKRMDISKVSAIGMSHPAISLFIAYIWLAEIPSSYQWGGILVMGLGIYFIVQTNSKQYKLSPAEEII